MFNLAYSKIYVVNHDSCSFSAEFLGGLNFFWIDINLRTEDLRVSVFSVYYLSRSKAMHERVDTQMLSPGEKILVYGE